MGTLQLTKFPNSNVGQVSAAHVAPQAAAERQMCIWTDFYATCATIDSAIEFFDWSEVQMKRVFISFKMENKKQVDGIRLLAWNEDFALEFYDESVRIAYKSDSDGYIQRKIKAKIDRSSVTVCFLGENTHLSEWVNWELAYSIQKGNKIVLMGLPNGPGQIVLPDAVSGYPWYLWDMDALTQLLS